MTARTSRKFLSSLLPGRSATGRLATPLQGVMLLVLIYLSLWPLVMVIWGSVRSDSPGTPGATFSLDALAHTYGELVAGGPFADAVLTSLALASTVAVLCIVLGGMLTWLVTRTDLPWRNTYRVLMLVPIFYSTLIGIIGWEILFSDRSGVANRLWMDFTGGSAPLFNIYSFWGVILVMVLHYVPYVLLITSGPMMALDSAFEQAAEISGASKWQSILHITLPLLMPAMVAAGMFIFILAIEDFSMPHILGRRVGLNTISNFIYINVRGVYPNLPLAAAAGSLLLLIVVVALMLYRRLLGRSGRYVTVGGQGSKAELIPLGMWRWPAFTLVGVFIFLTTVLPLLAVVYRSLIVFRTARINLNALGVGLYRDLFANPVFSQSLVNSLLVSLIGALACVCLGFWISIQKKHQPTAAMTVINYVASVPIAIPGILLGLGFLWVFVTSPLYLTLGLIFIAVTMRYLGLNIQTIDAGLVQLHRSLDEAACVAGASQGTAVRTVTLPLLRPVLFSIWLLTFLTIIRELSMSVLLYGPGSQTLPVLTWSFVTDGDFGSAAAVSIVQVVLIGLVIAIWRIFTGGTLTQATGVR